MVGPVKRTTTNYNLKVVNFDYPYWGQYNAQNLDVLDAIVFAATAIDSVLGVWENSTAYVDGNRVVDDDTGLIRECLVNHTSASTGTFSADRIANPTYWGAATLALTNAGTWATLTAYTGNALIIDGSRVGIIVANYTSDTSYDVDVAAGDIVTLIDLTTTVAATAADAVSTAADVVLTNADVVTTNADAASTAADVIAAASAAIGLMSTSTTSLAIGTGSKVFTTQAGKAYTAGLPMFISSDASPTVNYMFGTVTSYSGTTLTINVTDIGGSGTLADWTITVAGIKGATGSTGATGPAGPVGVADDSVRVATTADGTLATAYENGDTIDGVVLATDDLILIKDQSSADENGVYVVQASGAPARDDDWDTWDEHVGALVTVQEGTANADTIYLCTVDEGGTLETTSITFEQKYGSATTSAEGLVELLTIAEVDTGTDATRAMTAAALAGSALQTKVDGVEALADVTDVTNVTAAGALMDSELSDITQAKAGKAIITLLVFDDATDCAVADGAGDIFWRVPSVLNGYDLVEVAASCQTAGTTGTMDVQIYNVTQTADMLSTKLTIDTTETDTSTAATAAVIDTANDDVATGDSIRIDVDAIHTTAAKGLLVELTFQKP